jgi:SAM-dependent methyltransferase
MIERSSEVLPPPPGQGVRRYAKWIAGACPSGSVVLNIGAGHNRSGAFDVLLKPGTHLVGVDPDDTIHGNTECHERHQQSIEDFADANAGRFDTAFSIYVLEHVSEPEEFLTACRKVLKPHGSLFGMTLNMYQYFGFVTWATSRLRINDRVLHLVKGSEHGDGHRHDDHHFPTQYRLNSMRVLTRSLGRTGFVDVEFRCFDAPDRYAWYLPKPLKGFAPMYTKAAYRIGRPELMGHISFHAVSGD